MIFKEEMLQTLQLTLRSFRNDLQLRLGDFSEVNINLAQRIRTFVFVRNMYLWDEEQSKV